MHYPTILLLDEDKTRRRSVSQGLARFGYEVVPTATSEEAARLVAALAPEVVILPAELGLANDGALGISLGRAGRETRRTVIVLGAGKTELGSVLPSFFMIPTEGETLIDTIRRLRLVLLSLVLAVPTDERQAALVGELNEHSPLELVRALHQAKLTCRLSLPGGWIGIVDGEVVRAEAGKATGTKAFCRLGRINEGTFRLRLEPIDGPSEFDIDHGALLIAAIEDSMQEVPSPRTRFSPRLGPTFFAANFSEIQQRILTTINQGVRLEEILDALEHNDGVIVQELVQLEAAGLIERHEAPSLTAVITDTTSDLSNQDAEALGLGLVPLTIHLGPTDYLDRTELKPSDFYRLVAETTAHPTTDPPSAERFLAAYRGIESDRDILSLHISGAMSQTVDNARTAAHQLADQEGRHRVRVIDGEQVSGGLGLLAVLAARLAARGLSAEDIQSRIEQMRSRVHILFVVDSLDSLLRGGRIGRAKAMIGKLLNIKPILGIVDGEVTAVDRVRGNKAALPRILTLSRERLRDDQPLIAFVGHANDPKRAARLARLLEGELPITELQTLEIGPVVGAHAGLGTIGVCFVQPPAEDAELYAPLT